MRPKNAGINLEPLPEREREKRGKKIRAFCVTQERIGACALRRIDDFCAHHHQSIERRRRWWRTRFRRFRRFLLLDPVSRFSEGRSFSAFSLDVINYPRLISCDSKGKKKERRKRPRENDDEPKKRVVTGGVVTGVGREATVVYVVVFPRDVRQTKKERLIDKKKRAEEKKISKKNALSIRKRKAIAF